MDRKSTSIDNLSRLKVLVCPTSVLSTPLLELVSRLHVMLQTNGETMDMQSHKIVQFDRLLQSNKCVFKTRLRFDLTSGLTSFLSVP